MVAQLNVVPFLEEDQLWNTNSPANNHITTTFDPNVILEQPYGGNASMTNSTTFLSYASSMA